MAGRAKGLKGTTALTRRARDKKVRGKSERRGERGREKESRVQTGGHSSPATREVANQAKLRRAVDDRESASQN
jgi:hypothetical protein